MDKKFLFPIGYVIMGFVAILLFQQLWLAARQSVEVPYSEFLTMVRDGKVSEVGVANDHFQATLKSPQDGKTQIIVVRVDAAVAGDLEKSGVKFYGIAANTWLTTLLSWILPVVLFFLIWRFAFGAMSGSRGMGGFLSIGQSKARIYAEKDIPVTFEDVAGVDEAKDELKEIVAFLKEPKAYGRLGAHAPKGILLVGPPGTGKTLLARAVAGQAGVPFFSINGSEFVEMFVGVGAARVRDLFEQARSQAPCIVFIDELDALGKARGIASLGSNDEKEQTLNQLLSELDGFDSSSGVVLLAATNRPEVLDPALLRAGRFDRQIAVERPDKKGRIDILNVHLKKITREPGLSTEDIAELTPGFTGADLANLVNEAAMLATRRQGVAVTLEDFTRAFERIVAGLEKRNRLLNPQERKTVAYHEMGHALVAMSLPGMDPVKKISIIPRGIGALGYTIQTPIEDRYLMMRRELQNRMAVLLGGRAAEALVFQDISTGAADDLVKATEIARSMVMRYGMDADLGEAVLSPQTPAYLETQQAIPPTYRPFSEETGAAVDHAVRRLVHGALEEAMQILREKRDILERGARLLLERETLSIADLDNLVGSPGRQLLDVAS